jgi:two-component system nitrate/nitrite response regulator NarL
MDSTSAGRATPLAGHLRSAGDDLQVVRRPAAVRVMVALEQQLFAEVLRVALADPGGYDVVVPCPALTDLPEHAAKHRPDVILLDIGAKGFDGLEVLRRLRQAVPRTAVLLLSASPPAELLLDAMAEGAAGYLSLEADMADVVTAVQTAAEGRVVLSGARLESLVRHLARRGPGAHPAGPGGRLTDRETEVLQLLVSGASTATIAQTLFISRHTTRTHVQNVLGKLGVHSRLEAAAYAVRHGLVPPA